MSTWLSRSRCALVCGILALACSVDSRTLVLANANDDAAANAGSAAQSSDPRGGAPAGGAVSDLGASAGGNAGSEPGGGGAPGQGESSSDDSCGGDSQERRCAIVGGSFLLGPADAAIPAAVSSFELDQLEVTVRRFRQYVATFAGAPAVGAGAHPEISRSGWRSEWSALLPASKEQLIASLHCNADWETWTDNPGKREDYPLTCASYYVAFAFCAWSGGRLPTEAEWEYAASGGAEQRSYPWGNAEPSLDLALFGASSLGPGGARPAGMARFGQLDLAGSAWEWTLDLYQPYPERCDRCAEVEHGLDRVLRGGAFVYDAEYLKASSRFHTDPQLTLGDVGFRCARTSSP